MLLGYFSGLYFIKPDIDAAALLRTTAVVHLLDAVLCALGHKQYFRPTRILSEGTRNLLRAAFHSHDGYEVDTEGDAFFVVFRRAMPAEARSNRSRKPSACRRCAIASGTYRVRSSRQSKSQ
mgnify:CR=1 FL=1